MGFVFMLWVLAVYGLTNAISTSTLCRPKWDKLAASESKVLASIGELLQCPMCLGFWVGGVFSFFAYSVSGFALMDMCIASASTWLLHNVSHFLTKGEL